MKTAKEEIYEELIKQGKTIEQIEILFARMYQEEFFGFEDENQI